MNAERLEIARRFAACKGWVWLPGMAALRPYHAGHLRIESTHESGFGMSPVVHGSCSWFSLSELVPDLSDALTRAGLLPVVRQALGVPNLTPIIGADGWYLHGIPDDRPELWWSSGQPSELHALLAALEAAPGV